MNKSKRFLSYLDNIMWYIIYLLPIIFMLLTYKSGIDPLDVMSSFGVTDNIVFTTLINIFGSNGVVPMFNSSSWIFTYFSYFVCVFIIHLTVDFLLFFVRLFHDWMDNDKKF